MEKDDGDVGCGDGVGIRSGGGSGGNGGGSTGTVNRVRVLFLLAFVACLLRVASCVRVSFFFFAVRFLFFVSIHLSSRRVLECFSGLFVALSQNLSRSLQVFISFFFLPVLSPLSFL